MTECQIFKVREHPSYDYGMYCQNEAMVVMQPFGGGITVKVCPRHANWLINLESGAWAQGRLIKETRK